MPEMLLAFPGSHGRPCWTQGFQGPVPGHRLAPGGQMTDSEPLSNVILGSRCYNPRRGMIISEETILGEDLINSSHLILATREWHSKAMGQILLLNHLKSDWSERWGSSLSESGMTSSTLNVHSEPLLVMVLREK